MPTHILTAFLTLVCDGEGWQWSLYIVPLKSDAPLVGPCARCRFSLGVVECLSFHDPSRSCSFDAEPVFCSFLFALGVAGVM